VGWIICGAGIESLGGIACDARVPVPRNLSPGYSTTTGGCELIHLAPGLKPISVRNMFLQYIL
jgi:hypothetical protein